MMQTPQVDDAAARYTYTFYTTAGNVQTDGWIVYKRGPLEQKLSSAGECNSSGRRAMSVAAGLTLGPPEWTTGRFEVHASAIAVTAPGEYPVCGWWARDAAELASTPAPTAPCVARNVHGGVWPHVRMTAGNGAPLTGAPANAIVFGWVSIGFSD